MNCKLLGHRVMQQMPDHLEDTAWNVLEQFGSKKGCFAQELSLNMKLIDDIMHLMHSNGAFIFNNAKDCYDRIAHPIMSLALQHLGIPLPTVYVLIQTLQQMHHNICTGFGNSGIRLHHSIALMFLLEIVLAAYTQATVRTGL